MWLLRKINNDLKSLFEESSIVDVWLNPESDSNFSGCKDVFLGGCKLTIMYHCITLHFTYVNIAEKLINK